MIEAEVLGLLNATFKETQELPRRPDTDRNLTFDDVADSGSDSELEDLVRTSDAEPIHSSDAET